MKGELAQAHLSVVDRNDARRARLEFLQGIENLIVNSKGIRRAQ